jgi:hypothetical protein
MEIGTIEHAISSSWIKTWQLTGSESIVHIEIMGMFHSVDIVPPSSHEAVALLRNSLGA